MKRTLGTLLALALATGAGLAYAGKGGGGGGRGGGGHAFSGGGARPSGGFTRFTTGPTRFTTGPMRFTTGPHPGWRPIGRPIPLPPRPVAPIQTHPAVVGGGTVIVTAPLWYPTPYPYPYVTPVYGGSAYASVPTYSDAPSYYSDAPADSYQERSDYWYYCPDTQTYYPYVATCASPWVQVLPEPDPGTSTPQQ